MRYSQGKVLATVRGMQGFLTANSAVLGPGIAVAQQNLDHVEATLVALAAQQNVGTRAGQGGTTTQRVLRDQLRIAHMQPIAHVAALKLRQITDYPKLKMPRSNAGFEQLVTDAAGMAQVAMPHTQVFLDAGLAPDFIAQLRAAAAALQQSVTTAAANHGQRNGATQGLIAEEKTARGQMKLLNSLVRPKIANNATLLGEWDRVRKIPKKGGPVGTAVTPVPTHTVRHRTITIPVVLNPATNTTTPTPVTSVEAHPATASTPQATTPAATSTPQATTPAA